MPLPHRATAAKRHRQVGLGKASIKGGDLDCLKHSSVAPLLARQHARYDIAISDLGITPAAGQQQRQQHIVNAGHINMVRACHR